MWPISTQENSENTLNIYTDFELSSYSFFKLLKSNCAMTKVRTVGMLVVGAIAVSAGKMLIPATTLSQY